MLGDSKRGQATSDYDSTAKDELSLMIYEVISESKARHIEPSHIITILKTSSLLTALVKILRFYFQVLNLYEMRPRSSNWILAQRGNQVGKVPRRLIRFL